jgi:hypothetical protein
MTPSASQRPSCDLAAWSVAALLSRPNISDEDAAALLVKHGFPPGGAARACAMIPIAYGRRILQTFRLALPDDYVEVDVHGAVTRKGRLSEDLVYAQAAELAARAGREDIERIGLRSAEIGCLNQLLNNGGRPEDAVFGPPALFGVTGASEGGTDAQNILEHLLRKHGSGLKASARVFPRELSGDRARLQLDVLLFSPRIGDRHVLESFAGIGATVGEATADALMKFSTGSLHALLATLEDERLGGEQVTWETWGDFRVCLGPTLRQWSDAVRVDFGVYVDGVRDALLATKLSPEIHWHRTFVALKDDQVIGLDSLLDNDPWSPGEALARSWPWPQGPVPYALRQFVVLVPTGTSANKPTGMRRAPGWVRSLFGRESRR